MKVFVIFTSYANIVLLIFNIAFKKKLCADNNRIFFHYFKSHHPECHSYKSIGILMGILSTLTNDADGPKQFQRDLLLIRKAFFFLHRLPFTMFSPPKVHSFSLKGFVDIKNLI